MVSISEIAKKLKDSGFPMILRNRSDAQEIYELPDLSEIIESCGDKFISLIRNKEIAKPHHPWNPNSPWRAYGDGDIPPGDGETMFEAAANLYINIKNHRRKRTNDSQ